MKIGIITCWYKNISIADYSYAMIEALRTRLDVKIVSAHCACWRRYVGKKEVFQSECEFSSFPPHIFALESVVGPRPRIITSLLLLFKFALLFLKGILYMSKVKDCDIIHYQQSSSGEFGAIPLYILFSIPTSKIKFVTVHWLQPLGRLRFLYGSYKRANRVIVHSKDMKEKLVRLGVPTSKITIIPHGTTLPPLRGLERKEITFFGAPTEGKGFLTILQSLNILKEKGHKINLHVYGIYSEEEKNWAIKKANEIGVNHMVSFRGRLSSQDFDLKMQESLFTLAPYSSYVSGSSIVARAMGNGTPVIASDIGGVSEYLGEAGLLVEPNNSEQLALEMIKLITDPKLRQELSEKGRKRAKCFTWNAVANNLIQIYYKSMLECSTHYRKNQNSSIRFIH